VPIYEYYCKGCRKKFEKLIFEREEKIVCPKCGSEDLEKQFSSFSNGKSKGNPAEPFCPKGGCCPGCGLK